MSARRAGTSLLALALLGHGSCTNAPDEPRATRWVDDAGLSVTGFGTVAFVARDGHVLTARTYRSTRFDPAAGPLWFVMHGADRDADRYIQAAAPLAERYDALAIVVHFSAEAYPTGDDYTLGIEAPDGSWRAPDDMLYAEIEHLFDLVRGSLGGNRPGYFLFGHSAGAQFTHRLLTFLPAPRALGAVAANAGWYTLPTADDPDLHTMPYGLIGGPVTPEALARFFRTPFTVLLSEYDTTTAATDDLVRGTPEADAQGQNRLERGRHYFAVGQARASALGGEFSWRLAIAPRADHDATEVIGSAAFLTFVPGAEPCTPSTAAAAAGLVITELLADPPDSLAGDANGDGVRDPEADEFVEIANSGFQPVCLAGWTLGDASQPDRHIFPLGPALAPGAFLVVFGGGVPTGRFADAVVQRSAHGLSLQNQGDVLTLHGADGTAALQFSWGSCGGAPCAGDHWPGELGIGGSLTRPPIPGAAWLPHPPIGGLLYSPGFAGPVR